MTLFTSLRRKNYYHILVHISAWIVYASFIYTANSITRPYVKLLPTIFFLLPFCITFYVSIYCLNMYKQKGPLWSIASFFIVFFVMGFLGYCYVYLLLPRFGIELYGTTRFGDFLQGAVLGYVQYFSYAMLYFYVRESFRKERELRRLEEEKLRKELENSILKQNELNSEKDKLLLEYAFLRAQVNPHFLHNTLNVLFSQAMEYSQELADNILKLSRIMRYSLESVEFESDTVKVEKELEHLQLLMDINNIRFGNSKEIDYTVEGEVADQVIPPLSIITVVENAFKYGDLKDPLHPLIIRIKLLPAQVYFFCRNKKRKHHLDLSSHKIGIVNLRKRLDVAFANEYVLLENEDDHFYSFELTINS